MAERRIEEGYIMPAAEAAPLPRTEVGPPERVPPSYPAPAGPPPQQVASEGGRGAVGLGMEREGIPKSARVGLGGLLRFLQLAAAVVSFSVMTRALANGLRFQDFMAFQWLVAAMVIAANWALAQLLYGLGSLIPKRYRQSLITAIDFAVAWIALSAGSAAAGITTFADDGAGVVQPGYCQGPGGFRRFCAYTKASTAFAFITFFFFIPSLAWSTSAAIRQYFEEA